MPETPQPIVAQKELPRLRVSILPSVEPHACEPIELTFVGRLCVERIA